MARRSGKKIACGSCFSRRQRAAKRIEMLPIVASPTNPNLSPSPLNPSKNHGNSAPAKAGKKKTGSRLWMRFDRTGNSDVVEWDKSAILKRVSIPARDLRILGPVFSQSSNILARDKAMVVNLEFIKAIVTADEVLLLDPLSQEVIPFVDQLKQQLSSKSPFRIHETGHAAVQAKGLSLTGGQWLAANEAAEGETELPFEFQILEIALESVCSYLDSNVADLERDAYPILDELAMNVSTKNLERVRSLKSNLTRLLARVQKVRDEIEHLLDDNEDMAHLYLTRKQMQCQQFEAAGYMQEARTFFHSFREDHDLMHLRDLQKLEGVLSPQHLEEMELARSLRQSKVNLKLCEYSYDLLLQYLQKTQALTMLGIINEHINFQVSPGQPALISEDADVVSLMGSSHEIAKQINQKEVHWGLLEDSLEERLERAHSDSEKVEGENKEVDPDENKKRSTEGGKQGVPVKKLKKDKVVGTLGKNVRSETSTVSMAPRVKAELTLPLMPTEAEQSILEDLRNRVQLSSLALPSVSFYTFVNTHNGLNCSAISQDGSLVAGGFSDSSLKVWDVSKIGQASKTFNTQGEGEASQNELLLGSDDGKRSYTLFQGHTGPVYSATFCPLGEFLLSSSSDSTIRLWSTKLNSNLVCYKGHNYPVWDVQFSPVGHYFASCSHDRTARVWSMDKIKPLRIMAGHLSDVDCIQWHPNCNYISTGSSDKTVRLWDVQSGECVRIFIGHRGMVLSLAMSPDGRYMASGDEDGTIMVWDLSTGRCVSPLMGHSSCVWTLAFSCEGTVLSSGSADNTVKLWDVTGSMKPLRIDDNKTGGTINRLRLLKVLPTKSTPVYTLQFSRRNLLFAAGALSKC